jgi:hypothetical protein
MPALGGGGFANSAFSVNRNFSHYVSNKFRNGTLDNFQRPGDFSGTCQPSTQLGCQVRRTRSLARKVAKTPRKHRNLKRAEKKQASERSEAPYIYVAT